MLKAVNDLAEEQKVPQLRELLLEIDKKVAKESIAEIFAMRIDAALKKDATIPQQVAGFKIAQEYASLLKQYQLMTGEITESEISKMADEQLDAILRDEYGWTKGFAAALEREQDGQSEATDGPQDGSVPSESEQTSQQV